MKEFKFQSFLKVLPLRKKKIKDASEQKKTHILLGNLLAKTLHPSKQYAVISKIDQLTEDTKRIEFVPSNNNFDSLFAPFQPGSYISVFFKKDGVKTSRPYSICSSPFDRFHIEIAVRLVHDGFTSQIIHNEWKVGDEVELSAPQGTFVPVSLRDEKNIVAVAGGSGITPFLSMAKAIADGVIDYNLTIFYGARRECDLCFQVDFEEIRTKTNKVQIVYVLSDEDVPGYEKGFISGEILDKYLDSEKKYSFFVCGPTGLYNYMKLELKKRGIDRKHARFEVCGEHVSIDSYANYPENLKESVQMTVHVQDEVKVISADPTITILRNLENAGIVCVSSCRSGECGLCHSHLISGEVFIPKENNHLRAADKMYQQIHVCSTFAITDVEIQIPKGE